MQEQTGKDYDCRDCEDRCPELLDENYDVLEIWALCSTQWRVSAFSIIGIDLPAVLDVARTFGIEITEAFISKIKALEMYELNRLRKAEGGDCIG